MLCCAVHAVIKVFFLFFVIIFVVVVVVVVVAVFTSDCSSSSSRGIHLLISFMLVLGIVFGNRKWSVVVARPRWSSSSSLWRKGGWTSSGGPGSSSYATRRLIHGSIGYSQHSLESSFKVDVAQWVKDRVQGGIEIAEPDGRREHGLVDACLLPAVGHHHEEGEVGKPAEDERAHNDAQLCRSLLLLGQDEVGIGPADGLLLLLLLCAATLLADTVISAAGRTATKEAPAALAALTTAKDG